MTTNDLQDANSTTDTLMMFGGMALMLLGAGMVLTSPLVKKLTGGLDVGNLLQTAAPDLERYMKLKAM